MTTVNKANRNKRIAKNTLFLYFRMILVTIVSFFTARITLQVLGVEDFGIQNVVTSVVSFIGIITGALTSATQRFLAFDLGKNDTKHFEKTYSSIFCIFLGISLVLSFVALILGPWIIKTYLVIPANRQEAALYTYLLSIISLVASMLTIPFSSAIIAYEKMNVFARISIFDSVAKLVVVYLLLCSTFDKLVTLSALNAVVQIVLLLIYYSYNKKKLPGCRIFLTYDKALYKELFQYIGWNIFGYGAGMLCPIGISVSLNIFFGPLVNAAKGIADKINQVINQLSINFYMAVSPQIVKSYANHDVEDSKKLVCQSSKFTFYLMYIVSLPLILVMKDVLILWLGQGYITSNMVLFSQWTLIFSLVNALESPLTMLIRATGKIKIYQISVGCCTILVIPLCVLAFYLGFPAVYSMIIWTIVYAITHVVRLYIVKKQVGLKIKVYVEQVLYPIAKIIIPTAVASYTLAQVLLLDGLAEILIIPLCTIVINIICIVTIGLNKSEKAVLKNYITKIRK